jgi:hypothetical protein
MASPRTTRASTVLSRLRRAPSKPRMNAAQLAAIRTLMLMKLLAGSKRRSSGRR